VADTIDLPKVLCLPEPRRTAQWLRMSYVACNGNWDEFEAVYEDYCIWMEPRRIPKQSRNVPLRRQTHKGQRQPDCQSQEQRPDENDTREQQTPAECQEEMKVEQRPTRHITGPPLTRSGFLWALSRQYMVYGFTRPRVGFSHVRQHTPLSSSTSSCWASAHARYR
jgi:hypothetical protein